MPGYHVAENSNTQEAEDLLLVLVVVARKVVERRDGSFSVVAEDFRDSVVHLCLLRLIPDASEALERLRRLLPELEDIALALEDCAVDHAVSLLSDMVAAFTGPPGRPP